MARTRDDGDVDLIGLFGLNAEEAAGLGLGLPLSTSTTPPTPARPDVDDLALLAMLDAEADNTSAHALDESSRRRVQVPAADVLSSSSPPAPAPRTPAIPRGDAGADVAPGAGSREGFRFVRMQKPAATPTAPAEVSPTAPAEVSPTAPAEVSPTAATMAAEEYVDLAALFGLSTEESLALGIVDPPALDRPGADELDAHAPSLSAAPMPEPGPEGLWRRTDPEGPGAPAGDQRGQASEPTDPLLLEAFAEESAELLDALHVELENIEHNRGDHGALLEIRRVVHTIKGGAKMCLFEHVVTLTHACENLLDLLADGARALDTPALRALFACEPLLRALVQDALVNRQDEGSLTLAKRLAAHFDALCAGVDRGEPVGYNGGEPAGDNDADIVADQPAVAPDIASVAPVQETSVAVAPVQSIGRPAGEGMREEGRERPRPSDPLSGSTTSSSGAGRGPDGAVLTSAPVPVAVEAAERVERSGGRRGRESINVDLAKVDAVVAKVTEMAAHRSSYQGMVGQLMETTEEARRNILRLHELALGIGNECMAAQPAPPAPGAREQASWAYDLGLESYNALGALALQLQEAVADQQALIERHYDTIANHWNLRATESRVDADLQSALMNIRLIPLSTMRVRLDGVVRQAAQATGKSVRWQLQGGNVAVEKNVFDRLFEPLMHLLRNAVDHGLEAPAARRAAGKNETGFITVSARGEDNHVVITVADDGAGIAPERIAAVAVGRGVIAAERAAALSERQKIELIFTPGFSTAGSVSHLSGRGVGMDAVREACLRMGGAIDVESRPGLGATFAMRLPLSLSVTRGLIVRDGGCYMAVPVGQIAALHLVPTSDIVDRLDDQGKRGRVARIEGQDLPVYTLPPLPGAAPAAYVQNNEVHVLQVPHEGGSLGLIIEDVLDEEEMLIKAVPPLLRGVKTLLGSYVLPDGAVAPVVNLPRLLADLRPAVTLRAEEKETVEREPVALVVDDSLSMRVALSGTLQGAGFTVLTARDGQEALDVLKREGLPSIITLDIEMPRMDGLETLFAIRQMPGAAELPVFMMTSRGGAKHRRAAEQLGATSYFTKPYRDSEFAAAARAACALGA